MEIKYNVTGSERKNLVSIISRCTSEKAKYLGMPSMAYQIGGITVDAKGTMTCEDAELTRRVADTLAESGFKGEGYIPAAPAQEEPKAEKAMPETTIPLNGDSYKVTVEDIWLGRDLYNLDIILKERTSLFAEAFGGTVTAEYNGNSTVTFTFPSECLEPGKMNACITFAAKLVEFTKNMKVCKKYGGEIISENPKYDFRCFLLRLGFIGDEYKESRKLLMANLSGNSSFKSGH